MSAPAQPGGFSLFPNTSTRPPSRNQLSRPPAPRTTSPQPAVQQDPNSTIGVALSSPPRTGRTTPALQRVGSVREGKQPDLASAGRQSAMDGRVSAQDHRQLEPLAITIERPAPVADIPPRSETAFSEAHTLIRSNSNRSRSSIYKPPLEPEIPLAGGSSAPGPAVRSIFPIYNPEVPLEQQDYYPTQASPTHIPRGAISRPLYSPSHHDNLSPPIRSPGPALRSPLSAATAASNGRWPPAKMEPPVIPATSTTEELRGLWKVANGWKAPPSEGRVYVMKLTAEKDTPIYTLSSASQPLYNIRLDPTSASAIVTMSRHDPNRGPKNGAIAPPPPPSASAGSMKSENKGWQQVLSTTLEEESRKLPPNDGLVAILYPSAAAKMALERPDDVTTVMLAEHECARLVWDADSRNHFLVHPALAMPFCVTVERNTAWSRTEYTLEHLESPQHLARLTRDGTGTGWLEVDTSIAAKIDSVYLVDVAVAALMLVAHSDDQFRAVEAFEPPPVLGGSPNGSLASKRGGDHGGRSSRASRMSRGSRRGAGTPAGDEDGEEGGKKEKSKKNKKKKDGRTRMEEFEMDIESQTSELNKMEIKDKDKLPGTARGLIFLLTITFKCFIWVLTACFKVVTAIIAGLARCLTSDKL